MRLLSAGVVGAFCRCDDASMRNATGQRNRWRNGASVPYERKPPWWRRLIHKRNLAPCVKGLRERERERHQRNCRVSVCFCLFRRLPPQRNAEARARNLFGCRFTWKPRGPTRPRSPWQTINRSNRHQFPHRVAIQGPNCRFVCRGSFLTASLFPFSCVGCRLASSTRSEPLKPQSCICFAGNVVAALRLACSSPGHSPNGQQRHG